MAARTDAVPVPGTDNAASEHGEIAAHTETGGAGGPEAASPTTKSEESSGTKVAKVADSKTKEPATSHEVPAGAAGLADPADGILLRYNPDNRMWETPDRPDIAKSQRSVALPGSLPGGHLDRQATAHHAG